MPLPMVLRRGTRNPSAHGLGVLQGLGCRLRSVHEGAARHAGQEGQVFDLVDLTAAVEELTGLHVDVVSERGLRPGPNSIIAEARPL
jgi:hypothetical protein